LGKIKSAWQESSAKKTRSSLRKSDLSRSISQISRKNVVKKLRLLRKLKRCNKLSTRTNICYNKKVIQVMKHLRRLLSLDELSRANNKKSKRRILSSKS